jgi:hypothetical protein
MLLLVGGEGKQQARPAAAQAGKAGGGASGRKARPDVNASVLMSLL